MAESNVQINAEELKKLPYLIRIPEPPWQVPVLPYYDPTGRRFRLWSVVNGQLVEHKGCELVQGEYLAEAAAFPDEDYPLPLLTLVCRHFPCWGVKSACDKAVQDLINGLGFIEMYFVFLHHWTTHGTDRMTDLVSIELEAAFGNHRAFYDVIQDIVARIHLWHGGGKAQLPVSFRKMTEKQGDDLITKYSLPAALAGFYDAKRELFMACRSIRDAVFHHGGTFRLVYALDDGFAVAPSQSLIGKLDEVASLWPNDKRKQNDLSSLLAVFCLLAQDMFSTMRDLADCLGRSFPLPAPVFANEQMFLRTGFARHLHGLNDYMSTHWYEPSRVLAEQIERKT